MEEVQQTIPIVMIIIMAKNMIITMITTMIIMTIIVPKFTITCRY